MKPNILFICVDQQRWDCLGYAALSPEEYSWARDLKEIGYRNGYVGKGHVNPVHTPPEYGYDDYISREELEEAERRNGPAANPGGLFGNPSPSALSLKER